MKNYHSSCSFSIKKCRLNESFKMMHQFIYWRNSNNMIFLATYQFNNNLAPSGERIIYVLSFHFSSCYMFSFHFCHLSFALVMLDELCHFADWIFFPTVISGGGYQNVEKKSIKLSWIWTVVGNGRKGAHSHAVILMKLIIYARKKYHSSVTNTIAPLQRPFFGNHHLFLFITVIERALKLMNKKISITNNKINYLLSMIFFSQLYNEFSPTHISSSFRIFHIIFACDKSESFGQWIVDSVDVCYLDLFLPSIPRSFDDMPFLFIFFLNENNCIMWLKRIHMPFDLFNKMCKKRFYFFVCFGIFWHIVEFSNSNGKHVYFINILPVNYMIG